MIASATKFESKGLIEHFKFLKISGDVIAQAKNTEGLILIKVNAFSLRTLTVWKDEDSMRGFRDSGAHLSAMRVSVKLGTPWSITWNTENMPTWHESIKKINEKITIAKSV